MFYDVIQVTRIILDHTRQSLGTPCPFPTAPHAVLAAMASPTPCAWKIAPGCADKAELKTSPVIFGVKWLYSLLLISRQQKLFKTKLCLFVYVCMLLQLYDYMLYLSLSLFLSIAISTGICSILLFISCSATSEQICKPVCKFPCDGSWQRIDHF